MKEAYSLYRDGKYSEAISRLMDMRQHGTSIQIDSLLVDCMVKGNFTDQAIMHATEMYQIASMMFQRKDSDGMIAYLQYLSTHNILQIGLRVLRETNTMRNIGYIDDDIKRCIAESEKINKNVSLIVFPIVWPVAFGDMIVMNQIIKHELNIAREENPTRIIKSLVIIPFNRPDIKDVFEMSGHDYIIDIARMPEEADRMGSIGLQDAKTCFLNLSHQERMIEAIIATLMQRGASMIIQKWRYFPLLNAFGGQPQAGRRMWEYRAALAINGVYLPKICDTASAKENKIVLHFRAGGYGDPARDISDQYAQDLIDALGLEFPGYSIVRLGDKTMRPMLNCTDLASSGLSVLDQAKHMQTARLFIGSHSGPQHLAVAASDTPIVCLNYLVQETAEAEGNNIPFLSYAPLGENVKKVFHIKPISADGKVLLPIQGIQRSQLVVQPISEVIKIAKEILCQF